MYVHLGNNFVISGKTIVAVLNYQAPVAPDLREIVDIARLENKLVNISDSGKEKAVIVCDDKVYLSPISSMTLYKRAFNHYKEG
jgi:regulator of extracellular matrix RemA (YlzA/DUF370 family)